jgi:phosphatidylinositol-3-phosphatase
VIWIFMENHGYADVVGSPSAPYINETLIAGCGLATNYRTLTHLSLPNYIGAVTGLGLRELGPFLADCNPGGSCLTAAPSLFAQVRSWRAYEESMAMNCQPTGFVGYAVRHNPPPYLTALAGCATRDLPYTELARDLANRTLPAFAFITPDTLDDMHDGQDPAAIERGDAWLASELPRLLGSRAYRSGRMVVFVTFDEGRGGSIGQDCLGEDGDESCHVPTIVMSASTRPGTRSARPFDHYSLLRTTEELLGVGRRHFLGRARSARSMRRAFRL